MGNMSYCRYENTSRDLSDVIDALYESETDEVLNSYERNGLQSILESAEEIVRMRDKIESIIENSYDG